LRELPRTKDARFDKQFFLSGLQRARRRDFAGQRIGSYRSGDCLN